MAHTYQQSWVQEACVHTPVYETLLGALSCQVVKRGGRSSAYKRCAIRFTCHAESAVVSTLVILRPIELHRACGANGACPCPRARSLSMLAYPRAPLKPKRARAVASTCKGVPPSRFLSSLWVHGGARFARVGGYWWARGGQGCSTKRGDRGRLASACRRTRLRRHR